MLGRDYEGQDCSIARALEVVGERWTLLIIRDAFLGLRRFDQFQESLGIARNVLTDRLDRLVEEGILDRVRYSERPERYEYRLTAKGRDLADHARRPAPMGRQVPERTAAPHHPAQVRQAARHRRVRAEREQRSYARTSSRASPGRGSRQAESLSTRRCQAVRIAVGNRGQQPRPKLAFATSPRAACRIRTSKRQELALLRAIRRSFVSIKGS